MEKNSGIFCLLEQFEASDRPLVVDNDGTQIANRSLANCEVPSVVHITECDSASNDKMSLRWATALRAAGASDNVASVWHGLRSAVARHQRLLLDNGIGKEVSERDRVRVNARRVGLEAPLFADEAEATFADILGQTLGRNATAAKDTVTGVIERKQGQVVAKAL